MIHIIVAIDRNGAIGSRGDMLFHLRADLRRFKSLTMGHTLIMGRRTFDSLPSGALPGRRNIVVSRNESFSVPGAERAASLDEAIAMAGDSEIFVIGGAQIYALALPLADVLDLTVIDAVGAEPDTFFPTIPLDDFAIEKIEFADTNPPARFITMHRTMPT